MASAAAAEAGTEHQAVETTGVVATLRHMGMEAKEEVVVAVKATRALHKGRNNSGLGALVTRR
jgi:hypothetical protein